MQIVYKAFFITGIWFLFFYKPFNDRLIGSVD